MQSDLRGARLLQKRVQSHDILYKVSQDIPYTPCAR
jgi:hypothetical protein